VFCLVVVAAFGQRKAFDPPLRHAIRGTRGAVATGSDAAAEAGMRMYYKGGNMLHTIRQIVNDDEKWRSILIGLNKDFWHQSVTTQQVESYISEHAGIDLSKVFDQYLRTTQIPLLRYKIDGSTLSFKYEKVVSGFAMPIRVLINGKPVSIAPTESVQTMTSPEAIKTFEVDRNFYVDSAGL